MRNIVVVGGGTGTFTLLFGLKKYPVKISVIVSTADSGGSTGVLREELGVMPPGDFRQCLIALAKNERLARLFALRFEKGFLQGHNLGNIILAAAERELGDFSRALEEIAKILVCQGKIIPITLKSTKLKARLENGREIIGEHFIDEPQHNGKLKIKRVYLVPRRWANPTALSTIREAGIIILGPGDLYTSTIPNLLAKDFAPAIRRSRAKKIYICNLMTKFGQTNNFKVSDFIKVMEKYLGRNVLDYVLVNKESPPSKTLHLYTKEKEYPVKVDKASLREKKYKIIQANLLDKKFYRKIKADPLKRSLIRHDPHRLARLVMTKCFK